MKRFFLLLSLISICLLFACKGSKKSGKKDASFIQKRYHDLTSRDNSYFNAKMKMLAAKKKLSDAHKDDYTRVLALNKFGNDAEASAASGEMEEIVKKTSFVVQVHPVSKWVDDSYFLMGQAFYLKRDYLSALGTFQYIATELHGKRPTDKKSKSAAGTTAADKKKTDSKKKSGSSTGKKKPSSKKKSSHKPSAGKSKTSKSKEPVKEAVEEKEKKPGEKEEEKKAEKRKFSFAFLKHKPIRYDAMIWMIDAYVAQKKYDEALSLIKFLEADGQFPRRLKAQLAMRNADFYLRQEDYKNAIPLLEEGMKLSRKKKPKARYSFILAQCYEVTGDNNAALDNYKKVLRYNPTYEMEFNAKLKIAKTVQGAGSASIAEAKRILKSMLKDEKNEEFLDQIYFALAELALKENKEEEAIEYLVLAAQKSVNNNKQKALAFRKLAEIFYNKEKYPPSKNYYDSTLAVLPQDDVEHQSLTERRNVLAEAVDRILIIEREDSLQRIAKMSDTERDKFLTALIKKMKEEQQRLEDSTFAAQQIALQQTSSGSQQQQGTAAAGFYFYNSSAKSKGYQEFTKKWGNRTLEDNWRRKNKQSVAQGNFPGATATADEKTTRKRLSKEELMKNIPLLPEKTQTSNEMLLNALFDLGKIYREKLRNQKKAIETFEEIERRFPDNRYESEIYYNLYLLYANVDAAKSSYYKGLLESKHTNTIYAIALQKPDYVEGLQRVKKEINEWYAKIYQLYLENKFPEVISQKSVVDNSYKENQLQPKFDLLEALAIGKTQDSESFKKALQQVSEKHKGNEVATKADEMLKYLQTQK